MKLLAIDHTAQLGGAEIGLAALLPELGIETDVALLEDGPFVPLLRSQNVVVHVLNGTEATPSDVGRRASVLDRSTAAVGFAVRAGRQLRKLVKDNGYEVVLINTLRAAAFVNLCSLPKGVQRISMVRDGLCPPYFTCSDTLIAQMVINCRSAAIIANSEWTLSTVKTRRPAHVVYPAVQRGLFETEYLLPPSPEKSAKILLLGRIARWKGQDVGLRAINKLAASSVSVTVAGAPWFGEEDYDAELRRLADVVLPHAKFLGHVRDVQGLVDSHDIVLHTSTVPEPFGQVVVQAMARGRVIVAADAGGPREIVKHGETGMLYRPGEVDELAAILARLIGEPQLRLALGEGARKASNRFHPRESALRLEQVIDQVMSR